MTTQKLCQIQGRAEVLQKIQHILQRFQGRKVHSWSHEQTIQSILLKFVSENYLYVLTCYSTLLSWPTFKDIQSNLRFFFVPKRLADPSPL